MEITGAREEAYTNRAKNQYANRYDKEWEIIHFLRFLFSEHLL